MNGRTLIFLFATAILIVPRFARADDDVVQTVINLVSDKDKDVRAIGLEQVRDEAKGAEATRRFAALLAQARAEAQVGLLGALVGRGDAAAKPAVLELLKSSQGEVRAAAIRAIGPLGDRSDVPKLIALLGDEKSQKDAVAALTLLHGDGVNAALCSPLKSAVTPVRVARCETARRPALHRQRSNFIDRVQGQRRQGPRGRFGGAGPVGGTGIDRQAGS